MDSTPSQAARRAGNTGPEPDVRSVIDILRDRLAGIGSTDSRGFDKELNDRVFMAALRPLAESWFRIQIRGIDNIPAHGPALLAGNHSGAIAIDALMTQLAVFDHHPQHRHVHMLAADLVFETPVLGDIARAAGHAQASHDEAARLLAADRLVGVWPEGFKGVGKTWSRRYQLQQFGRGGFVAVAALAKVPIIPVAIVGAEEAYPMIANISALADLFHLPYFPLTPTWPLLGPLGMVPLPSKWIIEFGTPIPVSDLPDPYDEMAVLDKSHEIRHLIQGMVDRLVVERGSAF
jgi:1-acyl-sn-glycerol-3-phosphate acyltransferase